VSYRCLKSCDGRKRTLLSDWERWLNAADVLYGRFLERVGDSPFYYHEVASVGFLATAAGIAGFLPMNEYEIIKRGTNDRRTKGDGRADLWFDGGARCYSFEAKRAWLAATPSNLQASLTSAYNDIARIDREEYHDAAGLLLTRVRDEERIDTYEAFAQSDNVDLAYHIGPDGVDGAYLFFRLR
jgi:hypothetical protein